MNTIEDIARLAGVAKSTVSRYLNGGSISESTKKKIERIISETGYAPNSFAQSLKAKKPNIIGTIVPRLDSFATSQILMGIDEQLREQNYQMLISNTSQMVEREVESVYSLSNQKVAGILLLATEITNAHLKAFSETELPVILIGQQHEKVYSYVHNDDAGAFELGKYVLAHGHRKIAYLGVTEKDIAVGVKRKEGFKRAIRAQGDCEVRFYETTFQMEDAIEITSAIIDSFNPSIIVCATDNIAMGALKAAHLKGIPVPSGLSITGFGGYAMTNIVHPGMTTVKLEYEEAGRKAAEGLITLLNGGEIPLKNISDYRIIERGTVDNKLTK